MQPATVRVLKLAPAIRCICLLLSAFWAGACIAASSENLVPNGDFSSGLAHWRPFWSRQPGNGLAKLEPSAHSGKNAAWLEHRGEEDWSFEPESRLAVNPGELFELEVWVKLQGEGSITLCASTWDAAGKNVSWTLGERSIHAASEWKLLRTRFVSPQGVAKLEPRLIGVGNVVVEVADFALRRLGDVNELRHAVSAQPRALTNTSLLLTVYPQDGTFSVLDRRTGRDWHQQVPATELIPTSVTQQERQVTIELLDVASELKLRAVWELDAEEPEFTLSLHAHGELVSPLQFPYPFKTGTGDDLIVPMNEGISYPVDDASVEPFRLITYGGHGICMGFWGIAQGKAGHEVIIETPDDAAIKLQRINERLVIAPEWEPEKGQFGYSRRLRYIFFDQGGYVAMAKRYRAYVSQQGRLKTLGEKRRERPAIDQLVGAVNVWNWDSDSVSLVKEMQAAGIARVLWSRGGSPESIRELNRLGVLTSRYDIYQDVMDPANFPFLRDVHPDWTTAAWPVDLVRRADGSWQHGWRVDGKDGKSFDCGVLCDARALDYARARISAELATNAYHCRFIDTTTASPWNECYDPNHPMTRTESRQWKMRLLDCVSREFHLVAGSETGHDAAVPFVDYFEGMLSLGPYRVPDAGRDMMRIWDKVPERVRKFQLGHRYRLPLWELVYHDCVVAQWYWGDYNNKLPALWDKRDLFNALYGTPPMFMFNHKTWESQKERFVQSYRATCPVARATGYAEMTNHCYLTADRDVQQTAFANAVTVTVNFGTNSYRLPSGHILAPGRAEATGLPENERLPGQ